MQLLAKLGQENLLRMFRWLRWHCPPDTGFQIRALTDWGRARYLSVTEALHNTDFHRWMGEKHSRRVVVSTAAFHARVRGSVPGLGGLKETKNVSYPSTCESQYCGEPPWPRGSVLGPDRQSSISNPVSGGQCHLNHLTILRRFSWPSLAYMCTNVA